MEVELRVDRVGHPLQVAVRDVVEVDPRVAEQRLNDMEPLERLDDLTPQISREGVRLLQRPDGIVQDHDLSEVQPAGHRGLLGGGHLSRMGPATAGEHADNDDESDEGDPCPDFHDGSPFKGMCELSSFHLI